MGIAIFLGALVFVGGPILRGDEGAGHMFVTTLIAVVVFFLFAGLLAHGP